MKSRVIQDGPEPESSAHHGAMDLCGKQMQRAMNVAGRMGHWSATHWKTAVFGWLGCVVLLFAFGNIALGLKQIDINDAGVGQSHTADQILKKAFPERAPQTEFVLVQSTTRTVDDPAFRSTVNDVIGSVQSSPAIKSLDSPYAAAERGPDQRRPPRGDGQVGDEGRRRSSPGQHRRTFGRDGQGRDAAPRLLRGPRRGQLRQGTQQDVRRSAQAGRRALHPDHDRGAVDRAREPGRGRHPDPARPVGRSRHHRPRSRYRARSFRPTATSTPSSC